MMDWLSVERSRLFERQWMIDSNSSCSARQNAVPALRQSAVRLFTILGCCLRTAEQPESGLDFEHMTESLVSALAVEFAGDQG
jgi:hypothetical protein